MPDPVTTPTPTTPAAPAGFDLGKFLNQIFDFSEAARGAGQNRGATAADIADPFRQNRGPYQDRLLKLLGGGEGAAPGYQSTFQEKEFDPGTYQQSPGYTFGLDQGLNAVNSKGNAMFGTTRSGNLALDLMKYGTGYAQADYDKWRADATTNREIFNKEQDARRSADVNRNQLYDTRSNNIIDQLLTASGAKTGSPAAAAEAYWKGFAQDAAGRGSGGVGMDQILNLLTQGGSAIFKGLGGINWDKIFGNGGGYDTGPGSEPPTIPDIPDGFTPDPFAGV